MKVRLQMISDEQIKTIIGLFASWNPDGICVWGHDTEIFETIDEAVAAVRKIIEREEK